MIFHKNFIKSFIFFIKKRKMKGRDSNDVTLLPLFCFTFEIMKLLNSINYLINCPHVSSVDVHQI